jgi:DNA-binding MarR family transcriptional regulator/N-acetylglutamate synthase-like GNAT family acetyltransferase
MAAIAMAAAADPRVDVVRRFNRFYTRRIGALRAGLLDSPFSLTEARLLYELAHRERPTAAGLARELGLDAGYLSRMLRGLERRRLLHRERSPADGRQSLLALTAEGRRTFATLDSRSSAEVRAMLGKLSDAGQRRLVGAMRELERLLDPTPAAQAPYVLRPHRPGDMGWVVHRHGALYAQEYGWDERFEAMVARIVAEFIENFDARRERCWIAERDGEIVGAVFLVARSRTVAQLRMLYVEPHARGAGLGKRLVDECERFAREKGYRKIILWTNSILHAARHIYEAAGYRLVAEEPHHSFGHRLVGQTWELKL